MNRLVLGGALGVALVSGCLETPDARSCADYPRDTPECADYWGGADGAVDGMFDGMADGMRDGAVDGMVDDMADGMPRDMSDGMADHMVDGTTDDMAVAPDGAPDAGACGAEDVRPCGPAEGACTPGEQRCVDGVWGPCEGAVGPRDERCDGVDDDCNGLVDDVAGLGEPCAAGVGACRAMGARVCVPGGGPELVCDAVEGAGRGEVCNAVDDDCDGFVDEGIEQVLRPLRLPTMDAGSAPTLAALGEFFGAVWIGPEGGLGFALFAGAAYEVEPYAYREFESGDAVPMAVALDGIDGGFALALSGCDVGGCGVTLARLDERGGIVQTVAAGGTSASRIAVAANGGAAGLAWEAPGVLGQVALGFAHVGEWRLREVEPVLIDGANALYSAPALAWSAGRYGLVYLSGRAGGRAVAEFRALDTNGATLAQAELTGPGASDVAIAALRGHAAFVVSWVVAVDAVPTARAAVVDRVGAVVAGPFDLGAGVGATAPVPYDDGLGERVDRVGIGWLAEAGNRRQVMMRWIDYADGGWVLRATARLGEAQQAAALTGAYSVDAGPGLLWRDFDGRTFAPMALGGQLGCPTGPGLP